jgi:hypothetical protein
MTTHRESIHYQCPFASLTYPLGLSTAAACHVLSIGPAQLPTHNCITLQSNQVSRIPSGGVSWLWNQCTENFLVRRSRKLNSIIDFGKTAGWHFLMYGAFMRKNRPRTMDKYNRYLRFWHL